MLRRLEKRILVDLPTYEARRAMFQHHLPPVVSSKEGGLELMSELDYDILAVVSNWKKLKFYFFGHLLEYISDISWIFSKLYAASCKHKIT